MIVTLRYAVRRGLQRGSVIADKLAALVLDQGERELLGLTLVSDTTAVTTTDDSIINVYVIRTIILQQTAQGALDLPSSEVLIAATQHLYEGQIGACLPGQVGAAVPVIS